jgi:endonuclease YncB( thermonuclease family)
MNAYASIEGWAVVDGYQPDGDTIRFVPDAMHHVLALPRGHLVPEAADTSVAVRLEGIDAPELHYAGAEQPAARPPLDALLRAIGWPPGHEASGAPMPGQHPRGVRVRVVTRSCDAHGRVIGYLFAASAAATGSVSVKASVNACLLAAGLVYPLAYDSQPAAHRALFGSLATTARREGRGLWSRDRSRAGFVLHGEASLGVHGALVFPKVFRRAVSFFREATRGTSFREWLRRESGGDDPVRVACAGRASWRKLSDLLTERDGVVRVATDVIGMTFAEARDVAA